MNQEEKVEIVLKSSKKQCENASENLVKKRERPTAIRFAFTPRCMPQLTKYVKKANWDVVKRTLTIRIEETPDFEVYEWMKYINRRHKESLAGPFINLNEDAIDLKPLSEDDKELAIFRFKNITLEKHSCRFSDEETFSSGSGYLAHKITLTYKEMQRIPLEEADVPAIATNEVADEEWQTVEA